ncbi:MAG: sugar phosphate isomerase/epimerase [Phycisphaerae bacterium]|nr:sugar phosphate isomerase/epimerase [Phycisphaerae bacterium]
MRLSVSSYSLSRWMRENNKKLNQAIDWIANHAEGIEFSGLNLKEGEDPIRKAKAVRKRCDDKGLTIVGYCTGANLFQPDEKSQRNEIEKTKKQVEVAATLGVGNMRHDVMYGFPENWKGPKTLNTVLKRVVPAIRDIADFGQSLGVRTTLENHGFYMQAPDRVEKLIQTVNHPNYGLTIDLGNFLCVNADPVKAVATLAKYAIHAHIKDFHVKPKKQMPSTGWFATPTDIALRGAIIGHGNVDLLSCLKLLKKAGYKSWLSLEFEGMEEPTFGVAQGLIEAKRLIDLTCGARTKK